MSGDSVIGLIALVVLLTAGCSGGSGISGGASKAGAYCKALQKDWSTFDAADQKETDVKANLQGPLADKSAVSQQLAADHATFNSAASLASTLARSAPTKLKNDITTDTQNPQQALLDRSKDWAAEAKGDTQPLTQGRSTLFGDAGSTGCNFATEAGPDGTVATEFWP